MRVHQMRYHQIVRTTLDIDDDILQAAKELASASKRSAGVVLSELARKGMRGSEEFHESRNGVPLLPPSGEIVTLEKVRRIMDEEGI